MKAFDKDGNEIDVFSQEELDAKLKEISDKAATDRAEADAKAAADKAAADAAAGGDEGEQVPAWAKGLMDSVASLRTNHTQTFVEKVTNGLDADKRKLVEAKFAGLSGYDETAEGLARKAEDAYLLATGEKFNAGTVNMSNLISSGGGRTVIGDKVVTEADKEIQAALGITPADVEKFAKKN